MLKGVGCGAKQTARSDEAVERGRARCPYVGASQVSGHVNLSRRSSARVRRARRLALKLSQAHGLERHGKRCAATVPSASRLAGRRSRVGSGPDTGTCTTGIRRHRADFEYDDNSLSPKDRPPATPQALIRDSLQLIRRLPCPRGSARLWGPPLTIRGSPRTECCSQLPHPR